MREKFFVCDSCGCVDSTSSGTFHTYNSEILPSESRGKRLCCVCAPVYDANGRPIAGNGRWHGRFKRSVATVQAIARKRSDFAYCGPLEADVGLSAMAMDIRYCRSCGSPEVAVARSMGYGAVVCLQCGFGQRGETIAAAISAWNGVK